MSNCFHKRYARVTRSFPKRMPKFPFFNQNNLHASYWCMSLETFANNIHNWQSWIWSTKKLHPDSQGVITNYITETEKKNVQIHEVWLVVVASIQSSLIYIIIDTKSSGRNSSVRSDWRIKQIKIARDERHTQERRRRKTKKPKAHWHLAKIYANWHKHGYIENKRLRARARVRSESDNI